ncbi:hypothetical protein DR046_23015 [Jannaschia formosa]|nr:hypothetical protein DR046_23015 [Jannaschia formosa]
MLVQVRIADFPELAKLCWNRPEATVLDGPVALSIYERNWRHVDEDALGADEAALIETLTNLHGNGVFLA